MEKITFNDIDQGVKYLMELTQRIKRLGDSNYIRFVDKFAYESHPIIRDNDPLSDVVWKTSQNYEQFGDWFAGLDEGNQEHLRIYYASLSTFLSLYKTSDSYLLSTELDGKDILYFFINSYLSEVYPNKLELSYSSLFIGKWLLYQDGDSIISNHQNYLLRTYTLNEPVIIINSRPNYGHWIMDFFPLFIVANKAKELKHIKIFTKKLLDHEIELLEMINFDLARIIQQDLPNNTNSSGFFKESYVFNRVNPAFSASLIRSIVPDTNPSDSSDFVCLSRKGLKYSRIQNEKEVTEALIKHDFDIFDPTNKTVLETINKLRHSKIIVSTIGAQLVNAIFSKAAIVILLYPILPKQQHNITQILFDLSLTHCFPIFQNLFLLNCEVDKSAKVRNNLDYPVIVKMVELENLILKAKSLLRN
jgi:hypothetical protein